ncbi:MAG: hypothetical protein ACK4KV_06925 [Rhodocyclaceae bacterium]
MRFDNGLPGPNAFDRNASRPPGIVAKTLAVVATIGVAAIALMFSLLALSLVLAVGVIGWGYFWWKTRHLRKHLREQARQAQAGFEREADGAHAHARHGGTSQTSTRRNGRPGHPERAGDVIEGDFIREVRDPDESTDRRP